MAIFQLCIIISMQPRAPYVALFHELSKEKQTVFIPGPRQAGKTTFAKMIARTWKNSLYFDWDILEDKARLLENSYFFEEVERQDPSTPLVILDELQKYKDWKNYLKGVIDRFEQAYTFLVTGSGRLDLYRKGGDSLAGRYLLFHLWPLTLSELGGEGLPPGELLADPFRIVDGGGSRCRRIWDDLFTLSGFPEPFLAGRETSYRRWSNIYMKQLVREEIRDFAAIRSVSTVESLAVLLAASVGSLLSVPSLSRTLRVSYNTVQNWISLFEYVYLVFTVPPFARRISRAIQKARKVYFWNHPLIRDRAAQFENMVACELFRSVTNWTEHGLGDYALRYIRDKEGREVDFLITADGEAKLLVEAKLSQKTPDPSLCRFQEALGVPAVQLVHGGSTYRKVSNGRHTILVAPAHLWLPLLS